MRYREVTCVWSIVVDCLALLAHCGHKIPITVPRVSVAVGITARTRRMNLAREAGITGTADPLSIPNSVADRYFDYFHNAISQESSYDSCIEQERPVTT